MWYRNSLMLFSPSGLVMMSGVLLSSWFNPDWDNLDTEILKLSERKMICMDAKITLSDMEVPLSDIELLAAQKGTLLFKNKVYLSRKKNRLDAGKVPQLDVKMNTIDSIAQLSNLLLDSQFTEINTAHLDHLFEEINLNGEQVGIIHIYCEYPDYHWVGDDDEGIACVDDASRAAVFYLRNYTYTGNAESLNKAGLLLKFLLGMQADNGYFNNFIWPDHAIHKEGVTTKAEPNWWSWRTLWTYGEALAVLDDDHDLVVRIRKSRDRLLGVMLNENPELNFRDSMSNVRIPEWIGSMTSADQAALITMGLSPWYEESGNEILERLIKLISLGVVSMQVGDTTTFASGAFLSWKNLWHAYGNSQAYALLGAGQVLNDTSMTRAALYEVDKFYPSLMAKGGLSHFWVRNADSRAEVYDIAEFPQIAYNYRPMIWACLESWKVTGDEIYLRRAHKIGSWFNGFNPANQAMYDPKTGRTYDGIISDSEINKNSGAESTIEALLALQELNRFALNR